MPRGDILGLHSIRMSPPCRARVWAFNKFWEKSGAIAGGNVGYCEGDKRGGKKRREEKKKKTDEQGGRGGVVEFPNTRRSLSPLGRSALTSSVPPPPNTHIHTCKGYNASVNAGQQTWHAKKLSILIQKKVIF